MTAIPDWPTIAMINVVEGRSHKYWTGNRATGNEYCQRPVAGWKLYSDIQEQIQFDDATIE